MGGRKTRKGNKRKKGGATSLDVYFTYHNRFEKSGYNKGYLDQDLVDYYLNNNMDISELLDKKPRHGNNRAKKNT